MVIARAVHPRAKYGSVVLSACQARTRERYSTVCCERKAGNPLKKKCVQPEVGEAVDMMAEESTESVRRMLCMRFKIHTCHVEVDRFRQRRFREAGGRATLVKEVKEMYQCSAATGAASSEA